MINKTFCEDELCNLKSSHLILEILKLSVMILFFSEKLNEINRLDEFFFPRPLLFLLLSLRSNIFLLTDNCKIGNKSSTFVNQTSINLVKKKIFELKKESLKRTNCVIT